MVLEFQKLGNAHLYKNDKVIMGWKNCINNLIIEDQLVTCDEKANFPLNTTSAHDKIQQVI